ncbi:MAG TPA: heparinase II/III family protein [Candidatus Latescibacteria bacterium]|jgi:hypothetical protein|nr:heparinase [Gemmatimonadaceae bacterium]MDP6016570.1 heparinase II/III family protein [Candidatus Latescibacterota bacterium]HJP34093.1 heparinase II/III family protein [Candidatus Latescibacterota bacterium]
MILGRFVEGLGEVLVAPGGVPFYPLRADRTAWARLLADARSAVLEAGEAHLGFDWPAVQARHFLIYQRQGRQTDYLDVRSARRVALSALVLAECVEASGRFLDDIANGIWATCEETYWGNPGALYMQKAGRGFPDPDERIVELGTGETAALLAWTHALLDEALDEVSPMLRRRIDHELRTRVLDVCLARDDFWWRGLTGVPVNNWTPWVCGNWLTTLLLIEKDTERRCQAVGKILRSLDIFLDSYAEDGGCDEGPAYWNRAGASLLECLELLHHASGGAIDVYDHPKVRQIGRFPARAQIADHWFVNFADAPATVSPSASVLYAYGKNIGDDGLMRLGAWAASMGDVLPAGPNAGLARQLHALFRLEELGCHHPSSPPYPAASWLPGIQVLTARRHEGTTEGLFVAVKGGTNAESHNHNDVGNVIVYVDGRPVLVDPGVETYSARTFSDERYEIWTMQSAYHNLPEIGGHQQLAARRYLPGGVKYTENDRRAAQSVSCDLSDEKACFRADIGGAYPSEAGVVSWVREVTLDRVGKGTVSVRESVRCTGPKEIVFNLITPCEVTVESGVVRLGSRPLPGDRLAGAATLHHDDELAVETEFITIDDPRLRESWGDRLHRVRLRPADPVTVGEWVFEAHGA